MNYETIREDSELIVAIGLITALIAFATYQWLKEAKPKEKKWAPLGTYEPITPGTEDLFEEEIKDKRKLTPFRTV